jgi:hypothetical protein
LTKTKYSQFPKLETLEIPSNYLSLNPDFVLRNFAPALKNLKITTGNAPHAPPNAGIIFSELMGPRAQKKWEAGISSEQFTEEDLFCIESLEVDFGVFFISLNFLFSKLICNF